MEAIFLKMFGAVRESGQLLLQEIRILVKFLNFLWSTIEETFGVKTTAKGGGVIKIGEGGLPGKKGFYSYLNCSHSLLYELVDERSKSKKKNAKAYSFYSVPIFNFADTPRRKRSYHSLR